MLPQNIHYENGSLGNLLIWILGGDVTLIQYQFQLITRQPPEYLLPCFLRYRSGLPQLCQDIGSLVPLDQMSQLTQPCPETGRKVLGSICCALADAADRLLPFKQFSLHPSLVFLTSDLQVKLAFWPVKLHVELKPDPEGPARSGGTDPVLDNGQAEMERLLRLVGAACQFSEDELAEISQCLAEKGVDGVLRYLDTTARPANPSDPLAEGRTARKYGRRLLPRAWLHVRDICGQALAYLGIGRWLRCLINGPDDDTDDKDYQTVLLAANPVDFRMALLAEGRPGTPEENEGLRAFILVDEFLIGRETKNTDLCLPDPGMGRQHARIIRRAGSFFINDLGSRNGTRLDGRRLLKNTETLLPDQCILQFADRSFYFQVEGS